VQFVLIVIGKTNLQGVSPLVEEYSKRLTRFCKFTLQVLPDVKNASSMTPALLSEKEGEQILAQCKPSDYLVLLDERGGQFTSEKFALKMQSWMLQSGRRLVFVIGGAYGFSPKVKERADELLSLSPMTFNHQMVRAIFIEQLYRGLSILKGLPYHHAD
jgi:23S rRNA (pseudouridine1915-N3)-methyltransferase